MKYCLLIHISRDFISFLYNKEGDTVFVPYGDEPKKPLAVYCQGNEISIGKFALSEAQKGNKFAHANLFDAISSTELIEYKGQKYDINKLLFFAMEKYVAEFFDKILMRSEGSLEDNRAHFPVVLLFNPDLRFHERDYVVKSLIGGGYSNLLRVNVSSLFEKVIESQLDPNSIPIFVGSDGISLYCESEKAKLPEIIMMEKVCMDPRVDRAFGIMRMDILYEGYDEYRSDKESDEKLLRKRATDFLNSSQSEQMFSIQLSDGITYDLFLKRSDFGISSGSISYEAMNAVDNLKTALTARGNQISQCCIVLSDSNASTDYVVNLFSHYFNNVICITNQQRIHALQMLVDKVTSYNYEFPSGQTVSPSEADKMLAVGKFKEARELFRRMNNSPSVESKIAICTSCIKDERRIREFSSMSKEMRIREKKEILDIVSRWARIGVDEDYIQMQVKAIELLAGVQTIDNDGNSGGNPSSSTVDLKMLNRKWRETKGMVNGFLRERKSSEAQKELQRFIDAYKEKGADVAEAEQMLTDIEKSIKKELSIQNVDGPKKGTRKVESDQVSNVLDGVKLMKESKFKEAREWFSEHKLMAKAADCTTLIKAKRQIRAYKAELKTVENSHNLQLSKSHLDDMIGWRAIYVNYGLDTTEMDEIINSYKSIK